MSMQPVSNYFIAFLCFLNCHYYANAIFLKKIHKICEWKHALLYSNIYTQVGILLVTQYINVRDNNNYGPGTKTYKI